MDLINKTTSEPYKGPCWFIFSYDASAKEYDEVLTEFGTKIIQEKRTYLNSDFRKKIIRLLRKKPLSKVEKMDEPVETTIIFLDPSVDLTMQEKLVYWDNEFSNLVTDANFYFVIAPLIRYTGTNKAAKRDKPNEDLQAGFKKLFEEIKEEERQRN